MADLRTRRLRVLRITSFVVVLAVLLYSGLRAEPLPQAFADEDKWQHVLGFLGFAFTLRVALPALRLRWFVVISVAAAVTIELAQGLLPRRTPSMADIGAGLLGAGLGWACAWYVLRRSQPRVE